MGGEGFHAFNRFLGALTGVGPRLAYMEQAPYRTAALRSQLLTDPRFQATAYVDPTLTGMIPNFPGVSPAGGGGPRPEDLARFNFLALPGSGFAGVDPSTFHPSQYPTLPPAILTPDIAKSYAEQGAAAGAINPFGTGVAPPNLTLQGATKDVHGRWQFQYGLKPPYVPPPPPPPPPSAPGERPDLSRGARPPNPPGFVSDTRVLGRGGEAGGAGPQAGDAVAAFTDPQTNETVTGGVIDPTAQGVIGHNGHGYRFTQHGLERDDSLIPPPSQRYPVGGQAPGEAAAEEPPPPPPGKPPVPPLPATPPPPGTPPTLPTPPPTLGTTTTTTPTTTVPTRTLAPTTTLPPRTLTPTTTVPPTTTGAATRTPTTTVPPSTLAPGVPGAPGAPGAVPAPAQPGATTGGVPKPPLSPGDELRLRRLQEQYQQSQGAAPGTVGPNGGRIGFPSPAPVPGAGETPVAAPGLPRPPTFATGQPGQLEPGGGTGAAPGAPVATPPRFPAGVPPATEAAPGEPRVGYASPAPAEEAAPTEGAGQVPAPTSNIETDIGDAIANNTDDIQTSLRNRYPAYPNLNEIPLATLQRDPLVANAVKDRLAERAADEARMKAMATLDKADQNTAQAAARAKKAIYLNFYQPIANTDYIPLQASARTIGSPKNVGERVQQAWSESTGAAEELKQSTFPLNLVGGAMHLVSPGGAGIPGAPYDFATIDQVKQRGGIAGIAAARLEAGVGEAITVARALGASGRINQRELDLLADYLIPSPGNTLEANYSKGWLLYHLLDIVSQGLLTHDPNVNAQAAQFINSAVTQVPRTVYDQTAGSRFSRPTLGAAGQPQSTETPVREIGR